MNDHRYHRDKGLMTILTARLLNQICTLGFLIAFSGVLLLCINWHAIHDECLAKDTCDIADVRTAVAYITTSSTTHHR